MMTWRDARKATLSNGYSVLVRTQRGLVRANVEKFYFWTPGQVDIRWQSGAVQTVARSSIAAVWGGRGKKFVLPGAKKPTAPGWYVDPTTPGIQRWWSGQDWTTHTREWK